MMQKTISYRIFATILFLWITKSEAQTRIGDFIESTSYNTEKRGVERRVNYIPTKDGLVTENGLNKYTRALYGSHDEFRLETSDRPIFASYKKKDCHNISFSLHRNTEVTPLEKVTSCTSAYDAGLRRYVLTDKRWPQGAKVEIDVLMAYDMEMAMWRFLAQGFGQDIALSSDVSDIAIPKLHRSGDIGADKPGCFDAAEGKSPTFSSRFVLKDGSPIYLKFVMGENTVALCDGAEFDRANKYRKDLASTIEFDTPEEWINVLDGNLVAAADGIWDGKTWLHGAVGWRMPLAGWRAGYVGDVLGWRDRAQRHFDAYAASQVVDVEPSIPHPSQDTLQNLARAAKVWGTQMYSNGYICRNPERNDQMHHYDMNLNYIDELLWHFSYDASREELERYWPTIKRHLQWEKRNFDPDDDGLYDAYCCIWASDALYYSGGAVTHSSAYNLRAWRTAARIAHILGEDPGPYETEALKTQKAIDSRLWVDSIGCWAEYQDLMGLRRLHLHPALWTIYTAIDCGAGSPEQAALATRYVDSHIPSIPVKWKDESNVLCANADELHVVSTSDWMPYSWSINNVACAEIYNMALAYFQAGRPEVGYKLMKSAVFDNMLLGSSPGNFGQISFYDAARGECYRDFGDVIGVASRLLIQGLWGILPDALNGKCIIRPGIPKEWERASVKTPYLSYSIVKDDGVYKLKISQNFRSPLKIIVRLAGSEVIGTSDAEQEICVPIVDAPSTEDDYKPAQRTVANSLAKSNVIDSPTGRLRFVDMSEFFNDSVTNIFSHKYLSPRPQVTTLQIPLQGIGEWCHPKLSASICDSAFRSAPSGVVATSAKIGFRTPPNGNNIVFSSLWDNFPSEVSIPLSGTATKAYMLLAGSTNHMQSWIPNGQIEIAYTDGSTECLDLMPPINWCPIEQDYYVDNLAFGVQGPRPLRVSLKTGAVAETLTSAVHEVYGREIEGGAASILKMNLDNSKELKSLTIRTLSNDVVVGVMAITLEE